LVLIIAFSQQISGVSNMPKRPQEVNIMAKCAVCEMESDNLYKCKRCGDRFCEVCGDIEEKLCLFCLDDAIEDSEDEEEYEDTDYE
jgi:hypothetical protein